MSMTLKVLEKFTFLFIFFFFENSILKFWIRVGAKVFSKIDYNSLLENIQHINDAIFGLYWVLFGDVSQLRHQGHTFPIH